MLPFLFQASEKNDVIRRNILYWFRWTTLVGDVAHVREMRHAYEILVRRSEKKSPYLRHRYKWEDKLNLFSNKTDSVRVT